MSWNPAILRLGTARLIYQQPPINLGNKAPANQPPESPDSQCCICRESLSRVEMCRLYPCNHGSYHHACIASWFESKTSAECPLCRVHVEAYTYHTALGGNPEIHECVCGAYHHEADVFAAFAEAGQYHPPKNTDPRLAKTLRTIINNAASALAAAQAQDMFRRLVEAVGPDYEDVDGYLRVLRGYASVGNGGEQAIRMVARQASGRILVFVMGVAVREERVEQESGGDAFWDLL